MCRKSGDSVHLVEYYPFFGCVEHIHPSEAGTAKSAVYQLRRFLYTFFLGWGYPCRHINAGGFQRIFLGVIKKSTGQLYFVNSAHSKIICSHDRTANLKAVDILLNNDLVVMLKCGNRSPLQLIF